MENIKVKKAPKKLKAWIAKQVQVCQLVKGKARFAVQGMNACGRYKTVEIFSELPEPSFNYCKEIPYWQPGHPARTLPPVHPSISWRTKV